MSDVGNEEKLMAIRNSIDFSVVADNVLDIADFTVEKHEFKTGTTLSPEVREEAIARIKDALWQRIEAMKLRRQQLLQGMFNAAQETLDEVIGKS